jgi:hypothetical protein
MLDPLKNQSPRFPSYDTDRVENEKLGDPEQDDFISLLLVTETKVNRLKMDHKGKWHDNVDWIEQAQE